MGFKGLINSTKQSPDRRIFTQLVRKFPLLWKWAFHCLFYKNLPPVVIVSQINIIYNFRTYFNPNLKNPELLSVDNIKVDVREIGCSDVDRTEMVKDKFLWWNLVNVDVEFVRLHEVWQIY
jgi:hypothetical protein